MEQNIPLPEVPHVVVFRLEGNLVRYEETRIEMLCGELIDKSVSRFIFDFDRVQFVDSAGIGLIIKLASLIEKNHGTLLLCNPKGNVKNVFNLLGIEERFKIYTRLGDALETFGNPLIVETIPVAFKS